MLTSIRSRVASAALLLCAFPALPAHAVSKEMVQLQAQVQQLQEAVARLQQSNDERMGVLKDLVQQTADSVNRMSLTVGGLQKGLVGQQDAQLAKADQLSGQIQSLNDSLDELKARMARIDSALKNVQGQQQSMMAMLPQPGAAAAPDTAPPATSPAGNPGSGGPLANAVPAPLRHPTLAAPQAGPPVKDMYRAAYGDYMSAKYTLAASEFNDLIKTYPDDTLAGNAWFYLGEIDVRNAKPTNSVKDYDHLLERYPDNAKIPAAHLHKGEAMISMKQTDAGVRELRTLIQRFPNSPEAAQARSRLNALGVAPVARH